MPSQERRSAGVQQLARLARSEAGQTQKPCFCHESAARSSRSPVQDGARPVVFKIEPVPEEPETEGA